LIDIMATPYFNRLPPSAGCGAGAYNMPPVYDPFAIADADPERRNNGPADGVSALSARTLMRTAYEALNWPPPRFFRFPELPDEYGFCSGLGCGEMNTFCAEQGFCCVSLDLICSNPPATGEPTAREERDFQRAVGGFLRNSERGFRGLDFQARLAWEDRFGLCRKYVDQDDFVDELVALAAEREATVGDVVAALKDRLVGDSAISTVAGASGISEAQALEAIYGTSLDSPGSALFDLEARTRALCGALLSSPQFLLTGFAPEADPNDAERPIPLLTPERHSFSAVCNELALRLESRGLTVACGADFVTVEPATP
ncbi:MAG: hypothetical protein AAGC55_11500, partial [Myxococcota bacterium]